MSLVDSCIEILRGSSDGDTLAPGDLALVQYGVNGDLSTAGETALADLLARVRAGYVRPWLHGIEHLTIAYSGYVYWKGQNIEHWSGPLHYNEEGAKQAAELARRCMVLEARGEPVTTGSVIWRWSEAA